MFRREMLRNAENICEILYIFVLQTENLHHFRSKRNTKFAYFARKFFLHCSDATVSLFSN